MRMITGRIVAVQEERVRLVTESGEVMLLTVSNQAARDVNLKDLTCSQQIVQVEFTGQPNLTSGIVRHITQIK